MSDQNQTARTPIPDLRVAAVKDARPHPNADRLLVMDIDLGGGEVRQIVAGLVGHYTPEELVGLRIVVVANLKPARLRGEVSEGMLLAAEAEGRLGLLLAPDAEAGTPVRSREDPEPSPEITFQEFQEMELVAGPDGVTLDAAPLEGARLVMDREVWGRLR